MRYSGIRYDGLDALCDYSPHLMMYLETIFSSCDLKKVNDILSVSMVFGGLKELDFTRPATEVKFNPRPARIALILMREAGVKDIHSVCVSIASCVIDQACVVDQNGLATTAEQELSQVMEPRDLELSRQVVRMNKEVRSAGFSCAEFDYSDRDKVDALIICMSLFLDRIRHFHRREQHGVPVSNGSNETELSNELLVELVLVARRFIELGAAVCPGLCKLLGHWVKRNAGSVE